MQKEIDQPIEPESHSDLDLDECSDTDQFVCPQNLLKQTLIRKQD